MYCILPLYRKLYPAVSPRRRRMTEFSKLNSVSRSRTIFLGNGSLILVRNRTCTNSTHPHPHIKVLRELERTSSFSKATVSPVPPSPPNYIPQSLPVEGGCSRSRSRTIFSGNGSLTLRSKPTCTNYIHIPYPHIKVLRSFFKSDRSPRPPPFPSFPVIPASPVHIGGCNADH